MFSILHTISGNQLSIIRIILSLHKSTSHAAHLLTLMPPATGSILKSIYFDNILVLLSVYSARSYTLYIHPKVVTFVSRKDHTQLRQTNTFHMPQKQIVK